MSYRLFEDASIITVELEDSQTSYHPPKALLLNASSYFRSALQSGFQESSEHKLRLPGCETEVFKVFLYWLGNRSIPVLADDFHAHDGEEWYEVAEKHSMLLIKVWVFADACLLPNLQNLVVRAFQSSINFSSRNDSFW